jgi:uncharacterized glyoxalase superfamily protein PhnB
METTRIDEQAVVPMIAYEDGVAAMEWLARAFGFTERTRWLGDDRSLAHGEMVAGGGLIMLATPSTAYEAPRRHRAHCAQAEQWSRTPYVVDGVLVYVDDVDAHAEQARAAGAVILSEPEDSGVGKLYRTEDVEGHRWMFMQRR